MHKTGKSRIGINANKWKLFFTILKAIHNIDLSNNN